MKDLYVNAETGEVKEVETSKESIAEMKAFQEAQAAEQTNREAARLALLEKLGISEEEAALLLG